MPGTDAEKATAYRTWFAALVALRKAASDAAAVVEEGDIFSTAGDNGGVKLIAYRNKSFAEVTPIPLGDA